MPDVKVSALPVDSSLDGNHYVPINDPVAPTTKRTLLSTLAAFFFNQANIPSGSGSPITRGDEMFSDFVQTGLVWTGGAYASTRVASMTAGTVYINGRRILISAVTSRTFTASKDTYVDILDNADGTGTVVYTEVTNNAASPALAANSIRIAIVVTGASNIAAATSINQGGTLTAGSSGSAPIVPVVSSNTLTVSDSLGNLIYPTNPVSGLAGWRGITSNFAPGTAVETLITGLSVPIIVSSGPPRKLRLTLEGAFYNTSSADNMVLRIKEGATVIGTFKYRTAALNSPETSHFEIDFVPTPGSHVYTASISGGAANPAVEASATEICYLKADFV